MAPFGLPRLCFSSPAVACSLATAFKFFLCNGNKGNRNRPIVSNSWPTKPPGYELVGIPFLVLEFQLRNTIPRICTLAISPAALHYENFHVQSNFITRVFYD